MTLAPERGPSATPQPAAEPGRGFGFEQPVERWSTLTLRSAVENGDIAIWKSIVTAIRRDPYGRAARQVEEVLQSSCPLGIGQALREVLDRVRARQEANERAEVGRDVRLVVERSGLGQREFALRIGATPEDLRAYLDGRSCPSASLMIRMRRVSELFVRARGPRSASTD